MDSLTVIAPVDTFGDLPTNPDDWNMCWLSDQNLYVFSRLGSWHTFPMIDQRVQAIEKHLGLNPLDANLTIAEQEPPERTLKGDE